MNTIELNDPYTGEWTVFEENNHQYDGELIINTDDIIYKTVNSVYYRRVLTNDTVNVRWFGAKGDNQSDDTNAVQNAAKIKKNIFFPEGKYLLNIELKDKIIIKGEGTSKTVLKPFDITKAVINYQAKGPFWTYGTEFSHFALESKNKTGIGFSFSKSHENEYEEYDEYSGNVVFRNVYFKGFEKGIQALFGNIDIEFYSTGFSSNKYGAYFLDNKFKTQTSGGDSMHAGNKYFTGGEFSSNEVAVYLHNRTDGFGALNFNNVIFELNNIATYINTDNIFLPVTFNSCWNESNGQVYSTNQVSIDSWNNAVKSSQLINPHAHIFEGKNSTYYMNNGRVTDILIDGNNITLHSVNSLVESSPGVLGSPSIVLGENSNILLSNSSTSKGMPTNDNIYVTDSFGYETLTPVNNISLDAVSRSAICFSRINKISDFVNKINSISLEATEKFGEGSLSNDIDGQLVSDSKIFIASNKFNIPFTGPGDQYVKLRNSDVNNVKKGWYVITFDLKVLQGDPTFYLWNRNNFQLMQYKPSVKNKWQTVLAYAYVDTDSTDSFYFDVSGKTTTEFLLSAYQVVKFDTSVEARSYIDSKSFAV